MMTIVVPEWFMWLLFAILVMHVATEVLGWIVRYMERRLMRSFQQAVRQNTRLANMGPESIFVAGFKPDGGFDAYKCVAKDGERVTLEPTEFPRARAA